MENKWGLEMIWWMVVIIDLVIKTSAGGSIFIGIWGLKRTSSGGFISLGDHVVNKFHIFRGLDRDLK